HRVLKGHEWRSSRKHAPADYVRLYVAGGLRSITELPPRPKSGRLKGYTGSGFDLGVFLGENKEKMGDHVPKTLANATNPTGDEALLFYTRNWHEMEFFFAPWLERDIANRRSPRAPPQWVLNIGDAACDIAKQVLLSGKAVFAESLGEKNHRC